MLRNVHGMGKMVLKRQMEVEMGAPLGLGRVGSLGLGAGQQPGFAQSACMLPQGTEQPDLGGKQLIVGELEQQLLAWQDRKDYVGGALKLLPTSASLRVSPTFPEAAVVVPGLDLTPLQPVILTAAVLSALPALALTVAADSVGLKAVVTGGPGVV